MAHIAVGLIAFVVALLALRSNRDKSNVKSDLVYWLIWSIGVGLASGILSLMFAQLVI